MENQTPTRRSGRGRIPNRKYEDEPIEKLNQVLSSDSEEDVVLQGIHDVEPIEDDDFHVETHVSVGSVSDNMSAGTSHSSEVQTLEESIEEQGEIIGKHPTNANAFKLETSGAELAIYQAEARPWKRSAPKTDTRSQGSSENPISGFSRISRLGPLAGPAHEDQLPIVQSMKQWGDDATLPSKNKFKYHFVHTDEMRYREATAGWSWYNQPGGIKRKQRLTLLTVADSARYLPRPDAAAHQVLLGPYNNQKLFQLQDHQLVNADDVWSLPAGQGDEHEVMLNVAGRNGWVINAGGRIRSLAWAPNQTGAAQYLAIAIRASNTSRPVDAPSFNPGLPSPSSIQLWGFSSRQRPGSHELSGERESSPELKMVLCNEWGDAKQLKWCPMPCMQTSEDQAGGHVGLLAGVFDDGHVRVLDVGLDRKAESRTLRYIIESPALTIPALEKSICTCLCWLSQTDIAIGHSNGFLTVFSIDPQSPENQPPTSPSQAQKEGSPQGPNAAIAHHSLTPWLVTRIHQTYITSISQIYPTLPSMVASTSASGHYRLTSLIRPTADYVLSRRSHMPAALIVFHPALHGCIVPEDSREMVSFTGLRFWGNNIQIGEATGSGGITALDVGNCHPCVAWGGADGRVVVTNPIRKVLKGSEKVWQLCVFRHEWVRKPKKPVTSTNRDEMVVMDAEHDDDSLSPGPKGNARITEGYKIQKADVERNPTARSVFTGIGRHGRGNLTLTIYEEETGVTALAWNPNLPCGGWLAVGWGSGLLRVEDVAI